MKNNILISINNKNYYKIIYKIQSININIYNSYIKNAQTYLLISNKDLKKIKKIFPYYKIKIVKITGFGRLVQIYKKYKVFLLSFLIFTLIILLLNNVIFKVEVKTNNKITESAIINILDDYNIKPLRLKKRHKDIELVVDKILKTHDEYEWLEIKYIGSKVIVDVTEKTKARKKENKEYCNIVSKSDAKIISSNILRGTPLKEVNDYVSKGETIISGDITFNDEVKNQVCASGKVYGELWYKVAITLPFKQKYIEYTNKKRYNISVTFKDNEYVIFKSRIQNKKSENYSLYNLDDFSINLIKEKEYVEKTKTLDSNEAFNLALKKGLEKIEIKLNEDEKIIYQKVLKKEVNDSTIYLEIFVVTKENIGEEQILSKEELTRGKSST